LAFAAVAAFALPGLTGCGSVRAEPRSPVAMKTPSQDRDRDSDGVPDKMDSVPAPEPAPPGEAPASNAPAPPPPPPPKSPPGLGDGDAKTTPKPEPARAAAAGETTEARETSFIIYTATVTMAVYQVDQGLVSVERIAHDLGGYLSLKKDREITIRVPRARFEAALSSVDKIGDVIHRDVQAEDVTDAYVDVEIRIKNARAMQARLRSLLERAPVKEALEIEKELARVTEQLEVLEGKLKLLKDKIAYSTLTVRFEPRASAVQASRIRLPFPWLNELGLPVVMSLEGGR
jgi:hypothetical protein